MVETDNPAYFRQLCEHAGIALIACDVQGKVRTWNQAAGRMFGAAADRMIAAPILSVFPQGCRAAMETILHDVLHTGQYAQFDFDQRNDAGMRQELACTIAPIIAECGACLGASICIRDITTRIALQNELHESRKMASLGELAGALAHHFNNILGGVMTSVDYALGTNDSATTRRALQQTNQAMLRASALVNGLLAFAEGDRRGDDLSDFTEIVNEIADDLESTLPDLGIEFSLTIPSLPVVPVGRSQLLTVLRNITQNAVEAMQGGGRLDLEVLLEDRRLLMCIRDTGCGLDEAALARVFEPFWSTKGGLTTTAGEGTGLGLAIAHGIVQMMGGTISVCSEINKGSCFIVSLPLGNGWNTQVDESAAANS